MIPVGSEGCTTPVNSIRFGENGAVLRHCDPETLYNYAAGNYLLRPLERTQFSGLAHYDDDRQHRGLHGAALRAGGERIPAGRRLALHPDRHELLLRSAQLRHQPGADAGRARDCSSTTRRSSIRWARGNARISGGIARRVDELGLRNFAFERCDARHHAAGCAAIFRWATTSGGGMSSAIPSLGHRRDRSQHDVTRADVARPEHHHQCLRTGRVCHSRVRLRAGESIWHRLHLARPPPRSSRRRDRLPICSSARLRALRSRANSSSLPAGPISAAMGFEHRDDEYDSCRGQPTWRANTARPPAASPRADMSSTKSSREIRVPILSDKPFADVLAIEGAVRYSDYSNFGTAETWRAGLEWGPLDWLRLRSAYNVAIRAPAISELFAPIADGLLARQRSLRGHSQPQPGAEGFLRALKACRQRRSTPSCRPRSASTRCPVAIPTCARKLPKP